MLGSSSKQYRVIKSKLTRQPSSNDVKRDQELENVPKKVLQHLHLGGFNKNAWYGTLGKRNWVIAMPTFGLYQSFFGHIISRINLSLVKSFFRNRVPVVWNWKNSTVLGHFWHKNLVCMMPVAQGGFVVHSEAKFVSQFMQTKFLCQICPKTVLFFQFYITGTV